ncbi:MAG: hypothetical protein JWN12_644 [Candidatus Saccharibacteria bacterium]|nr:hypothetical protein [Candidatus Saccharibacteria bacterium]
MTVWNATLNTTSIWWGLCLGHGYTSMTVIIVENENKYTTAAQ